MYRCNKLNISLAKKSGKPEPCKYCHRVCQLPSLENYEYCIKHILEDKTAPFKSCGYVYAINGKKCTQPAPKGDRKESVFCPEHTRKAQVLRQRAGGRHCPPQTVESLLSSLSHYTPSSSSTAAHSDDPETDDNEQLRSTKNPFVEIDAAKVNLCGSRVLDYVSESDSDVEPTTLDSVWRDADRDSSDAESIDSQQEDPLKHAGIYTAEEVCFINREKLCRLQSLYIDQLKRLQHVLKERKRRYVHNLMKEKETLASIHSQSKTSAKEMKLYEKLKALNRFHKHSGQEGVLHFRVKDKRNQVKKMKKFKKSRLLDPKSEGSSVNPAPTCKCSFTIGGVKCGLKTLPSSKFCRKHILHDPHQVLFRPCGCEKADVRCQEPTVDIFENASCMLHITLPTLPHLNIEKSIKEDRKDEGGGGDSNRSIKVEPDLDVGPGGDVIVQQRQVDKETEKASMEGEEEEEEDIKPSLSPRPSSTATPPLPPAAAAPPPPPPPTTTNETNDIVMDDIMANVDVVEEVIMSQAEDEQPVNSVPNVNGIPTASGS